MGAASYHPRRRREMGLGGLKSVSLKEARELAAHFRD